MYDAILALHREDKVMVRLQMNSLHNQGYIAGSATSATSRRSRGERLSNSQQFFGVA